ncbi:MAG: Gfo/Idh/MocA family protein [Bacteriovoracia bacterium]
MEITPFILGSGKAATAIIESLRVIETIHPELTFFPPVRLKRNEEFPDVKNVTHPVLFIANPHALHAKAIIQGEKAGFKLIVCEKPAAINIEQIHALKMVKIPVAVLHVYRQTWGIQTLKEMIDEGELGDIISIEGRYWQSSSAEKAIHKLQTDSWKNNPELSGHSDVLADLASHWVDAAVFLAGKKPREVSVWRTFINAEAPHRDTHVHLNMIFPDDLRAMASVSKTVHGAPNHFEINIIGSKKYAAWNFLKQDLLEVSEGSTRSFITRKRTDIGSGHWPHHGLGWIEGYVEVIYQALKGGKYPTLQENLTTMSLLFQHTYG